MKNVRITLFPSCKPGILPQSIRRPKVRQARLRKLPGNRPPGKLSCPGAPHGPQQTVPPPVRRMALSKPFRPRCAARPPAKPKEYPPKAGYSFFHPERLGYLHSLPTILRSTTNETISPTPPKQRTDPP